MIIQVNSIKYGGFQVAYIVWGEFLLVVVLSLLVERSHNLAAWRQQANKQERENKKYVEIISMMSLKLFV